MGSTLLQELLAAQVKLTGARPLVAAPGRNSIEQIRNRMAQEALISGSRTIEINHFLGALIGHPNGGVRFHLQQAIRDEHLTEADLRERLGLAEYDVGVNPNGELMQSEQVSNIWLLAELYAKGREENMKVPDLLAAAIATLNKTRFANRIEVPRLSRLLIQYMKRNYPV